jgi:hypothetical protein
MLSDAPVAVCLSLLCVDGCKHSLESDGSVLESRIPSV